MHEVIELAKERQRLETELAKVRRKLETHVARPSWVDSSEVPATRTNRSNRPVAKQRDGSGNKITLATLVIDTLRSGPQTNAQLQAAIEAKVAAGEYETKSATLMPAIQQAVLKLRSNGRIRTTTEADGKAVHKLVT